MTAHAAPRSCAAARRRSADVVASSRRLSCVCVCVLSLLCESCIYGCSCSCTSWYSCEMIQYGRVRSVFAGCPGMVDGVDQMVISVSAHRGMV